MTDFHFPGAYPATRLRRPRAKTWSRDLCAESDLLPRHLVQAVILREDDTEPGPVPGMPGVQRHAVGEAVSLARRAHAAGIPALALFPHTHPHHRDEKGSGAFDLNNLMCRAARAIKEALPEIGLIADVALDPYTDHGHDGLLDDGVILNDETVAALVRQATVLAEAGYDILAPSDMMDGRIGAIRKGLDGAGYEGRMILSYAAKYASAFYGPYRDAIGSRGILSGDKRTYQMDPRNAEEALREVSLDIAEGADMVMVKPGMPYLDIVSSVRAAFGVPTLVFQVSGEYSMLKLAAEGGAFAWEEAALEALTCFRRAGADGIISYYALEAADWLNR